MHCLKQTSYVQAEKYYCRKKEEWEQVVSSLGHCPCSSVLWTAQFLLGWIILKTLDHDFLTQGWNHARQTYLATYFFQHENFGMSRGDICWFRDSLRNMFTVRMGMRYYLFSRVHRKGIQVQPEQILHSLYIFTSSDLNIALAFYPTFFFFRNDYRTDYLYL